MDKQSLLLILRRYILVVWLGGVIFLGSLGAANGQPPYAASPVSLAGAIGASSQDKPGASKTAKPKKSEKERIDETLHALADAWSKVKAFSAKIKTNAKRDIGDRAVSMGQGIYNLEIGEKGMRLRYYIATGIAYWMGKDQYVTKEHLEFATDGTILEKAILQPGVREIRRTRYNPDDILAIGGRSVINDLRKNFTIKSMTNETRDGRETVVLHCGRKGEDLDIIHAFDKQTGVRVEWTEKDASGEVLVSIKLEGLNLSPKFDDEDFRIAPFINHTLIDETGPERKVIPWEEVVKNLSPEERRRLKLDEPKEQASVEGPPAKEAGDSGKKK